MRILLAVVMTLNTALFFFAALLNNGVAVGRLHEPQIIPATVVEVICGTFLARGARRSPREILVAQARPPDSARV